MIAETISVGVLSLPSVLATIGLVPGILVIFGFGCITTYTGYVIGQFKLSYPSVLNAPDAGEILFGRPGRYIFAVLQIVYLIFNCSAHIVTFVAAFDAITSHGSCSIVFSVVAVICYVLGSIPPHFRNISYLAGASFASIVSALLILIIALGVDYHPSLLPPLSQRIQIIPRSVPFYTAFSAAAQVGWGYGGHITFFAIITDFRQPKDYYKSLIALQVAATVLYTVTAAVIYVFTGDGVPSPALGAASPIVSKIAYGVALVTIIGSGSILGHVNAKYAYQEICALWRPLEIMSRPGFALWTVCTIVNWLLSWIIAESIPSLNNLLSLISAIFVSFFTFGFSNILWFQLERRGGKFLRGFTGWFAALSNLFIFAIAIALFGIGIYASGKRVHDAPVTGVWSCSGNA